MTTTALALGLATITFGAAVQATVGFGAALVSAPLLLLIDPRFVPGPLAIAGVAVNVIMAVTNREHTDWSAVPWLVTGLVPGSALAAAALALVSGSSLALLSASAILVAVAVSATGRRPAMSRRTLLGAGFFAGYMGTSAGVGGPPLALAYQDAPGRTLRATLATVFLAGATLTLSALSLTHHLDATGVRAGLVLAPGGAMGFVASRLVVGRFDGRRLRVAVLVISAVSAAAVILRVAL